MAKFVVFEKVSEMVYQSVDKSQTSNGMQTTINLGSGLIAGFAAALVSQPADTMLSKINKTKGLPGEGTTSRLIKIGRELGLRGSYTGIGARLVCYSNIPYYPAVDLPINSRVTVHGGNPYSFPVCNLRRHQKSTW